jgi:hypothetical protein
MQATIRWLRLCYWAGALLDGGAVIQMLWPRLFGVMNRLPEFAPGADYRFAMGMGASLMAGWTALLLWADRRPLERKGVLPLTVIPVVVGLVANEGRALANGFLDLGAVAPLWVAQTILSVVFLITYFRARRLETTKSTAALGAAQQASAN